MSSFRKPYTVKRYASGQYVNGIWQDGQVTNINIKASVQPLNLDEIEYLPEGRRSSKSFKIYTDTELFPALQEKEGQQATNPDVIVISGKDYEIIRVLPYQSGVINHYKCYAVEVGE